MRFRLFRGAIGGESVVDGDRGPVGDDIVGHPALHPHRLQGLAVLAAVEHWPALLIGLDSPQHLAQSRLVVSIGRARHTFRF